MANADCACSRLPSKVVAGPKVSDNRPFGPSSIKLVSQGAPKKGQGQAKQKTPQKSSSSANPTYTKQVSLEFSSPPSLHKYVHAHIDL